MIQIKDLTITYPDGKIAVSELNLKINDGENGCDRRCKRSRQIFTVAFYGRRYNTEQWNDKPG